MKTRTAGHTETTISGDTRADWSEAFEAIPLKRDDVKIHTHTLGLRIPGRLSSRKNPTNLTIATQAPEYVGKFVVGCSKKLDKEPDKLVSETRQIRVASLRPLV